ncbi:MAG TPA: TrmJ/YjtD family RNA methyltransferase [Candidatus Sulfotelmatobacter sp.]|nr:TrmJ/YjtD family RNA methyltransferase [Candidatus Sulfotelmatobacter sp.]
MNALPSVPELDHFVVVLVRARNPLNIGAVARAMSNFGFRHLRLVNPYRMAFQEAKSAVGALSVLEAAQEYESVAEAVSDCSLVVGTTAIRDRNLQHAVHKLSQETGIALRQQMQSGRVALLFGSEKIGLTNDDFSHCHWLMNIPTSEENISMNLGQAVAVCLYEIARSEPVEAVAKEKTLATAGDAEQITDLLFEALKISGYVKPGTAAMFEKKTRGLILRFNLEAYDAKLLLGMVRQILWQLRNPRSG